MKKILLLLILCLPFVAPTEAFGKLKDKLVDKKWSERRTELFVETSSEAVTSIIKQELRHINKTVQPNRADNYLLFKKDGTFLQVDYHRGEEVIVEGTYKLKKNKIIIIYSDGYENDFGVKIDEYGDLIFIYDYSKRKRAEHEKTLASIGMITRIKKMGETIKFVIIE